MISLVVMMPKLSGLTRIVVMLTRHDYLLAAGVKNA